LQIGRMLDIDLISEPPPPPQMYVSNVSKVSFCPPLIAYVPFSNMEDARSLDHHDKQLLPQAVQRHVQQRPVPVVVVVL
jgi:hypothetical protein